MHFPDSYTDNLDRNLYIIYNFYVDFLSEVIYMNIQGILKMTLLDFPGKVACTIFTGGCNFRCPFCHNAPLVLPELFDEPLNIDEIFSFLEKRRGLLDGVCLSGGEPLMQPDTKNFLKKVKDMGYLVKLDTNGFYPDKLKEIVSSGIVDYVAMDIKNSEEKYAETCGLEKINFSYVKESIDFLISGYVDYEFRTTTVKGLHDEQSFKGIAQLITGADNYFIQSFTPSDNMLSNDFSAFSKEELDIFMEIVQPYVKNISLRGI